MNIRRTALALATALSMAAPAAWPAIVNLQFGGVASVNELGMGTGPGDSFGVEFMLDTALPRTGLPPLFRDPWWWHFFLPRPRPWDWLRGFEVELLGNRMLLTATFDDMVDDMVMGLGLGSRFITTIDFQPGVLAANSLPGPDDFAHITAANLEILDPAGARQFAGDMRLESVGVVPEPTTIHLLAAAALGLIVTGSLVQRRKSRPGAP